MPNDLMIHDGIDSSAAAQGSRAGVNIASHLVVMARSHPDQRAIVWRKRGSRSYAAWTFAELDEESDRYAQGLSSAGIHCGTRTILMVRPTAEFFALSFALFKMGAVPVLVDPGMGHGRMAQCLAGIDAEAFIGVPLAHVFRLMHFDKFKRLRIIITVGRKWAWGGQRLTELRHAGPVRAFDPVSTSPDDPAAIIFTTGSTGPPKAVLYCHGMFDAQIRALRDQFHIERGEIDLPTFPLFALFDPALGMTAVLPEMDPTRPARVNPRRIIRAIEDQKVTHMFGSPALLDRVGRHCERHNIRLPSLRRIVSAGAPVPPATLKRFVSVLSENAEIHTPYGATEALPVASIASREILGQTSAMSAAGAGTCVGRPVGGTRVRIIRIGDEPIGQWRDDLQSPREQVGEIVVSGPVVTREYLTDGRTLAVGDDGNDATRLAKISDGDDFWHRMGDVGYFDEMGRLWFCGRKAHRVETLDGPLFTDRVEGILNQHPAVFRSALVGVGPKGRQIPVVCIELEKTSRGKNKSILTRELLEIGAQHEITRGIKTILFHRRFPVDIRHNAKIFREKLAVWAAKQL
jgi:acyl-CoA synthetase (AMP-forming)/AMP-acid ligase II